MTEFASYEFKTDQLLNLIDSLLNSKKYDAAVVYLNELRRILRVDFLNKESTGFKPSFYKKTIPKIIKCAICENENVSSIAKKLIAHICLIFVVINPLKFLKIMKKIMTPSNSNVFVVALTSISAALDTLDDASKINYYPFLLSILQNIINNIYDLDLLKNTDTIFQIVGQFSPRPELEKIILNDNEDENENIFKAAVAAKICNFRKEITSQILLKKRHDMSFLKLFIDTLNYKLNEKIDFILNDIKRNIQESSDFIAHLEVLNSILEKIDLNQENGNIKILKDLSEELVEKLKNGIKNKMPQNDFIALLNTLYLAVSKNLIDKRNILQFVKTVSPDDHKIISLKIMFLFPDDDKVLSVLAPFLLKFHNFQPSLYSKYLKVLKDNISCIDDDMLALIVNDSTTPLPLLTRSAYPILKFLNFIPKRIYKNQNININPYEIAYKWLNYMQTNYPSNLSKSQDKKLISKFLNQLEIFVKRLNLKLNYAGLDFFSEFQSFSFISEIDFNYLKELLSYRLIHPYNLLNVLEFIRKDSDHYSFYFPNVVSLLYYEMKILGFNLQKLYKELNLNTNIDDDHPWILQSDLLGLFIDIDTIFQESYFGRLIESTLETIYMIYQPHLEGEIATLASCAACIFCERSLDIIENKINKSGKILKQIIKIFTENISLPLSKSVRVSEFLLNSVRINVALSTFMPYLKEATARSRKVADTLADHITPDMLVKPVPTFLSFVGSNFQKGSKNFKKWGDYVDLCQQIIEPENWILQPDDKERIEMLVDHDNGVKQKAIELIPQSENIIESSPLHSENNEIFDIDERSFHFIFHPIGQHKTNKFEDLFSEDELYGLTVFLWHSQKSEFFINKKFSFSDLEEIALNNPDNINLLIGFFNYCSLNNKPIQLKRWCDVITVEKYKPKEILMLALFFENIHCKFNQLPLKVSILAQNTFTSFGFPLMTKSLLIRAFQILTGVKWFFVRSLIGIDPDSFSEYSIILGNEYRKNEQNTLNIPMNNNNEPLTISLFEYFVGISSSLFLPTEYDLNEMIISPVWDFPTNRKWPIRMLSFTGLPKVGLQHIKLDEKIFNDIIEKVKNEEQPKSEILLILMNSELTSEQRKIFSDVFLTDGVVNQASTTPPLSDAIPPSRSNSTPTPNQDTSNYVNELGFNIYLNNSSNLSCTEVISKFFVPQFLSLSKSDSNDINEVSNIYSEKPPSLTLKLYRTILCQFARPVSQNLIQQLKPKLTSVHPALCYQNFIKQGITIWESKIPKNFPLSLLEAGALDPSILNLLTIVSYESIKAFSLLRALDDREVVQLKEVGTAELINSDIIRTFLNTLSVNQQSNIYFTKIAMEAIFKSNVTIDELFTFICNREFLQSNNFLCASFIFLSIERYAKEQGRQDVVDFCSVLKSDEAEVFDDPKKQNFLKTPSNIDILYDVLHDLS